jgi:hypothetical protein
VFKKKSPSRCRGKKYIILKKGSKDRITAEPERKLKKG